MSHVRRQIRDAVIGELSPVFTPSGYLVTARRVTSLETEELPAILVSLAYPNESIEPVTMGMGAVTLERTAMMNVSGVVTEDEPDLDDKLEEIAERIEQYMSQDHGGLAKSTLLNETTKEFNAIGEVPVAAISLQFVVIYHTASNNPSTPL